MDLHMSFINSDEIMDSNQEPQDNTNFPIGPLTRIKDKRMDSLVSMKEKTIIN